MSAKQPRCHHGQGSAVICAGGGMSGSSAGLEPMWTGPAATPRAAAVKPAPAKEVRCTFPDDEYLGAQIRLCLKARHWESDPPALRLWPSHLA